MCVAELQCRNHFSLFQASEKEEIWVLRISILVIGTLQTIIAIFANSVYGLYFLCSDLVYVVLFPQLVCVLWVPFANGYGCLAGYVLGLFFRISAGEALIGLPPFIYYPLYTKDGQGFPFRTFSMFISLFSLIGVSYVTDVLFRSNMLPKRYDFLKCVTNIPPTRISSKDKITATDGETEKVLEKATNVWKWGLWFRLCDPKYKRTTLKHRQSTQEIS